SEPRSKRQNITGAIQYDFRSFRKPVNSDTNPRYSFALTSVPIEHLLYCVFRSRTLTKRRKPPRLLLHHSGRRDRLPLRLLQFDPALLQLGRFYSLPFCTCLCPGTHAQADLPKHDERDYGAGVKPEPAESGRNTSAHERNDQ